MGKNEGNSSGSSSNTLAIVSIVINIVFSITLGVVIVFLQLNNKQEIQSLKSKLDGHSQEILSLRHKLHHLNNTVSSFEVAVVETSSDKNNGNKNDYDVYEEYDDPNNDNYEDEEEEGDAKSKDLDQPKFQSLISEDSNRNDTRPKRHSITGAESITTNSDRKNLSSESPLSFDLSKPIEYLKELQSPSPINLLPISTTYKNIEPLTIRSDHIKSPLGRLHSKEGVTVKQIRMKKRQTKEFSSRGNRAHREEVEVLNERAGKNIGNEEIVAAHYYGNESICRNHRHKHCDQKINYRRYHPDKHLKDWESSSWLNEISSRSAFHMHNGVLTVEKSGLYFVYAQVFYIDDHDLCGFTVLKNDHIILQCTTTTDKSRLHTGDKTVRHRNSCYTASLVDLKRGDKLTLKETDENRYTLFEKSKSFFGLFRVGVVQNETDDLK